MIIINVVSKAANHHIKDHVTRLE